MTELDIEAESRQEDQTESRQRKFYGKYRGVVVNNVDPLNIGRIQAIVPDVSGEILSSWAMPCVPMAGIALGIIAVPPLDAGVWIEFEQGDSDFPIWTGCFWGDAAELPVLTKIAPPAVMNIVLETFLHNGITINDVPGPTGGIMLKTSTGARLIVNDTGIYIQNGKGATITMIGPQVSINGTALTVI